MKKTWAADQTELGEQFKVSRQTVAGWALKSDFPERKKKGWSIKEVDAWAKQNQVGPYRQKSTRGDGSTLTEVRIKQVKKRTRRDGIALRREMRQLAIEEGEILLASDVEGLHRQIASTSMTMLDCFGDAMDREAPEQCPTPEAWAEVRQRLILAAKRIARDVARAIEGFIAGVD